MKKKYCNDLISESEKKRFLIENIGKKVVLIYGNCHTTAISYKLKGVYKFNQKYAIFPLKAIQDVQNVKYFDNDIFQMCDVFIHQDIRINNKYGPEYSSDHLIRKLRNECKVISIPNLYHLPLCFFPQYIEKTEFIGFRKDTCFFRDEILDEAYKSDLSLVMTIRKYISQNTYNVSILQENFNTFIDKLKKREQVWDVKISDFILEHYKKEKLFYDPNHPTPLIINEIVIGILRELDLSNFEIDKLCNDFRLDTCEMPLSGSVVNAFSMRFYNNEIRTTGRKIEKGAMYLEDYINQYFAMEWQNTDLDSLRRIRSFYKFLMFKIKDYWYSKLVTRY